MNCHILFIYRSSFKKSDIVQFKKNFVMRVKYVFSNDEIFKLNKAYL